MLQCQYASAPSAPAFAFPRALSPTERYLWDLEEECEEILADAYSKLHADMVPDLSQASVRAVQPSPFDERGRQTNFRESVRQRQARLEFVRRQEFARRLALKGLASPAASQYAVVSYTL